LTIVVVKEEPLERYIIVLKEEKRGTKLFFVSAIHENERKFSKDTYAEQTSFVFNFMF